MPPCSKSYDVFVSFRGADIRDNFLTHLDVAFKARKVKVFIDTKLERGEEISSGLLKAIEESKVALIIFSQNYAFSSWCLEELVKIMECRGHYEQRVVPVFYRVDPVDVENQSGIYGEALAKHEKEFENMKLMDKWRNVLTEASHISGWDSRTIRNDAALIEEIVNDIATKLSEQVSQILEGVPPDQNKKDQCRTNQCTMDPCETDECETKKCGMDLCQKAPCGTDQCQSDQCKPNLCKTEQCRPNECTMDQCQPDPCCRDQCGSDQCQPDQCGMDQCQQVQCQTNQDQRHNNKTAIRHHFKKVWPKLYKSLVFNQ